MDVLIKISDDRYKWIKEHKGRTDFSTTEMLYNRVRRGKTLEEVLANMGEELRTVQKSIKDENVLLGFNLAVSICNKHCGKENG